MIGRKFILTNKIEGIPKPSDFQIVEEKLTTELQDGEILVKAEWISVDPYMRIFMENKAIGEDISGSQVGRVLKSRCEELPEDTKVIGNFGWRDLTIFKPEPNVERNYKTIGKIVNIEGFPDSYALGGLGSPGITAYCGFTTICHPKPGETLVVSGAAGAVGSLVGQIGKIYGCKVIGFAGNDAKVKWLKEIGFDYAFNYKTVDVNQSLQNCAPEGVDMYFDNVGGVLSYEVMQNMKKFGRISKCGYISNYNNLSKDSKPMIYFDTLNFLQKSLKMEGFNANQWDSSAYEKGIDQLKEWTRQGKLKIEETVTHGFENIPQAFINLFDGKNTGKQVVKV